MLGLCTAACPLPIAHTEVLAAPVVGTIRKDDGTAVADARVAVSITWGDTACMQAPRETTTDSAGMFELPGIGKQYSVTWVVPLLDRVAPAYRLCVGSDDGAQTAYFGQGSLSSRAPVDSLTCLAWTWAGHERVTCSAVRRFGGKTLASGGVWTEGAVTGWYQLILTEELTKVKGRKALVPRPRAYVQWIEPDASGQRYTIRDMIQLPIDPKVTALWEIDLMRRDSTWYAIMRGTKPKFMNDFASTVVMIELGPPGHVRSVETW